MKIDDYVVSKKFLPWVLVVGLLIIIIPPWIYTRPWPFLGIDFMSTGQIGDTIGGITAPFVNGIGAILVFYSFLAQQKANRLQFDSIRKQNAQIIESDNYRKLSEIVDLCNNSIYKFTIFSRNNKLRYEGILALQEIMRLSELHKGKRLNDISIKRYYLDRFSKLNELIENCNLHLTTIKSFIQTLDFDDTGKMILLFKVINIYNEKLNYYKGIVKNMYDTVEQNQKYLTVYKDFVKISDDFDKLINEILE